MKQIEFAIKAKQILADDPTVIGLAVGGSWLTDEIDEFSDLDLIIVTRNKVSESKAKMLEYAARLGNFLSGFTGEHVGEPRVLICLYDNPLLHVDLKFLTLEELKFRVETPTILLDTDEKIATALQTSDHDFPFPDYQWIEDRFWTWIHYALLKIGRGEYLEAFDFLSFLRMVVFGPLLHIQNNNLPRGVRKVETDLSFEDFAQLKETIPTYDRESLLESLKNGVKLYINLRKSLFNNQILLQTRTEETVMDFFKSIETQ